MTMKIWKQFAQVVAVAVLMMTMAWAASAAEVGGAWNMVLMTEIGDRPMPITLSQQGEDVSGSLGEFKLTGSFREGKLSLKIVDFYAPEAGFKADLVMQGAVEAGKLTGSWSFGEYSGSLRGEKADAAASATSANPNGTWDLVLLTEVGDKPARLMLKADGETVTGQVAEANMPVAGTFREGTLAVKIADFYSPDAGFKADLSIQGKIEGDSIVGGRWTFAEYSGGLRGSRSGQ
ncbi:MAG: hypothetical protein MUF01_16425 [Bryobacterales bacterium]|jgi:hypothetical protein|nr:hypothetical protein [Bryobacterales bacterium]